MPRNPIPLRHLHIFLAKEEFRDPAELLVDRDSLRVHAVRSNREYLGLLFVKPSHPRPPDWLRLFEGALDEPENLPQLLTSSASAVLIMECEGRTFLLTFGHGRSLVADGVVEPRFGLKATLNAIHPDKLRSLDRKTFERIQRLSREQLSRDSGFHAFGLNVEQDLLSAVVGVPEEEVYGKRLAGRDALSANVNCNLDDLRIVLGLYLDLSEGDRYRELFPWVDNIAEVSDRRTRNRLDHELCRKIQRQDLADIVLTPPDLIDWEDFGHFAFRATPTAPHHTELNWEDYFREVRQPDAITLDHLKTDRIACAKADGAGYLEAWSLRRCIAGEIVSKDGRYVLSEGKWYRIDQNFAQRVETAIQSLPCCEEPLPAYAHTDEQRYNEDAAARSSGRWALMDRKMIQTGTAFGKIEFCDLFSDRKRMIHVKRHAGSAPLSHLFAQGVVSARLYQSDASFRQQVNTILPESHRVTDPNASIDPREYEIAFAIVGSPKKPPTIPFFSMVNLRGAVEILKSLNYKVSLTHV